jgi:hypothetical protein
LFGFKNCCRRDSTLRKQAEAEAEEEEEEEEEVLSFCGIQKTAPFTIDFSLRKQAEAEKEEEDHNLLFLSDSKTAPDITVSAIKQVVVLVEEEEEEETDEDLEE